VKPRPRIRKVVKWGGLVGAGAFAAAWAASAAGLYVVWTGAHDIVDLISGGVVVEHHPWSGPSFPPGERVLAAHWRPRLGVPWMRPWFLDGRSWELFVPFWIPALACAVPSAWAWRLDAAARRRERAGRCAGCGYDLAGLAAGLVCPECGVECGRAG
jgi:hypothetical protein